MGGRDGISPETHRPGWLRSKNKNMRNAIRRKSKTLPVAPTRRTAAPMVTDAVRPGIRKKNLLVVGRKKRRRR